MLAEKTIYEYGGNGIYLGGEDILCFAPIACVTKNDTAVTNTIFDLVKKLDEDFKSTVQQFATDAQLAVPTLSYGISIHYFKSPLKEAMSNAHGILEEIKRNVKGKNAIGFYLQKHSGKYMACTLQKSKAKTLNSIYEIVANYCRSANENKKSILSSIIQKFRDPVFTRLYIEATLSQSLDALFANYFNEDIHKESDKALFLQKVQSFSENVIKEYFPTNTTVGDYPKLEAVKIIFTVLRFIHFINSNTEN